MFERNFHFTHLVENSSAFLTMCKMKSASECEMSIVSFLNAANQCNAYNRLLANLRELVKCTFAISILYYYLTLTPILALYENNYVFLQTITN